MSTNAKNTEARIPPQAIELEESVLGSMLIEREAVEEATRLLAAEDFYRPAHQIIFTAIRDLYDQNQAIDLLTVEQKLRDQGNLDTVGGRHQLTNLTDSGSPNIAYHAQILIEKSMKRKIIRENSQAIAQAYDSNSDVYDLVDSGGQFYDTLAVDHSHGSSVTLAEGLPPVIQNIAAARANPRHITGVPSGLDIDQYTSGWQSTDLIIVAGRPSMGKTAFALTVALNAAGYPDETLRSGGVIFSLEMSRDELIKRFISIESGIPGEYMRSGKIKDDEFDKIRTETVSNLNQRNIIIDDAAGIGLRYIRSKTRSYKRNRGIRWAMIDYLQLMNADDRKDRNREQEIATISRGLKALAKETGIPVIALAQLSRAVEQRGGSRRPQLSDLRDSGQIEQDADVILFLYRPEYYKITNTEEGRSTDRLAEIIVAKQRNGSTGTAKLSFHKEIGRFDNLTFRDEPAAPTAEHQRWLPYADDDENPGF